MPNDNATGLTVRCELDEASYPKAIKVTDAEMASLNIETDDWHPEWNYTIRMARRLLSVPLHVSVEGSAFCPRPRP